jgi:hypothetical protein
MLLDAAVERRKFDREVALLNKNAMRLRAVGAWIVRMEWPDIDVMFVPRLSFRIGLPTTPTGLLVPGQPFQAMELPGLAARAFGVRINLDGYDQRAPSVTFRDPWTWDLAPYAVLPIAQLVDDDPAKPQIVLLDAHPMVARPFLCLRGVREYHEHPQHDGDDWAIYRSATNVYVLIERIARVALASVRPQVLIGLGAPGQMQMMMQWAAEVAH